jgi:hypothetical protein
MIRLYIRDGSADEGGSPRIHGGRSASALCRKTFPGMVRRTADPSASPDFLWNLVALANFMRLSLLKGAHAALSYAAWQEIRVRSGWQRGGRRFHGGRLPDRSRFSSPWVGRKAHDYPCKTPILSRALALAVCRCAEVGYLNRSDHSK